MPFDLKQSLDRLAAALPAQGIRRIPILPFDKYLLMSGLQKAIRRGDAKRAASFALSLYQQDRRALYRRLSIIAFEDVGPAASDVVATVTAAVKSPVWRQGVGDAAVAVELAKQMATAPKTRYLTELYGYCDRHPNTAKTRKQLEKASGKKLEQMTLDPDALPYERALALWGMLGTRKYPANGFSRPQGDIDKAIATIKALPVPDEVMGACLASMIDNQWPLAAFLPLGWLATQAEGKNLRTQPETPLSSPEFEGLPLYAIDGLYTRLGQIAVRQLRNTVDGLKLYTPAQIGEALFFIEAETLNPRLTSDHLDDFRRESQLAAMLKLGSEPDDYAALNRMLVKRFDIYNDLRLDCLKRSLYGVQNDLFTSARK